MTEHVITLRSRSMRRGGMVSGGLVSRRREAGRPDAVQALCGVRGAVPRRWWRGPSSLIPFGDRHAVQRVPTSNREADRLLQVRCVLRAAGCCRETAGPGARILPAACSRRAAAERASPLRVATERKLAGRFAFSVPPNLCRSLAGQRPRLRGAFGTALWMPCLGEPVAKTQIRRSPGDR